MREMDRSVYVLHYLKIKFFWKGNDVSDSESDTSEDENWKQ